MTNRRILGERLRIRSRTQTDRSFLPLFVVFRGTCWRSSVSVQRVSSFVSCICDRENESLKDSVARDVRSGTALRRTLFTPRTIVQGGHNCVIAYRGNGDFNLSR